MIYDCQWVPLMRINSAAIGFRKASIAIPMPTGNIELILKLMAKQAIKPPSINSAARRSPRTDNAKLQ